MTRREWLTGAAAAVPALAQRAGYAPLLGAQIYVWTQQFQKEKKTIAEGEEEAFAAIRRAGYGRVELMAAFFTPELRDRTAALLDTHGLQPIVVYNSGPMHEPAGAGKTVAETLALADTVHKLGTRGISFNPNPVGRRKTDEELAQQARSLDELGAALRKRGMRLLVHQHAPEMAEGAREWRYGLQHTDPANVSLCLDLDWVKRGGQDTMALLREAAPRIGDLHIRSARQGVWMEEVGDGDVDYREVVDYLRSISYRGYLMVELAYEKQTEISRPLEEDLRRSREYVVRTFGLRER